MRKYGDTRSGKVDGRGSASYWKEIINGKGKVGIEVVQKSQEEVKGEKENRRKNKKKGRKGHWKRQ